MTRLAAILSSVLLISHTLADRGQGSARQFMQGRGAPPPVISTAAIPRESPLASRVSNVPDVTVETIVGTLPRLPRTVRATYRDNVTGPGRARALAVADRQQRGGEAWQLHRHGQSARHDARAEGHGHRQGAGRDAHASEPPRRGVSAEPGRARSRCRTAARRRSCETATSSFAASRRAIPTRFSTTFATRSASRSRQARSALEGWDDQTTRLRGHASGHYLTRHRAGICEHDLRRGAAGELPAEDELPDRHALRPLAEVGQAGEGGRAVRRGSDGGAAWAQGRDGYDSNLRAGAIRTDYWNWGAGFISAYPPDQFIMLEKGATYGTRDSQIWAPYYTLHKILAGLLDSYEVAGNKKALEIARGMGTWAHTRLRRCRPRRAPACGAATSPANTAA